jgi:hypothetical protein
LGWYQLYNNVKYATYTSGSKWSNILTIGTENFIVWNVDGSLNEANFSIFGEAILKNSSNINVAVNYNSLNLLHPIRFLSEEFNPLPRQNYSYYNGKASYSSDVRKRFGYSVATQYGTFYNGTLLQLMLNLNYRVQPWGNFALTLEQNNIKLAADYGSDNLTLLGLRADIAFSKNIIWANYVQYNKQRETFLVNSRLQWRYQPMSDLFLVYTDNYLTTDFSAKYRALVFKLSYWW